MPDSVPILNPEFDLTRRADEILSARSDGLIRLKSRLDSLVQERYDALTARKTALESQIETLNTQEGNPLSEAEEALRRREAALGEQVEKRRESALPPLRTQAEQLNQEIASLEGTQITPSFLLHEREVITARLKQTIQLSKAEGIVLNLMGKWEDHLAHLQTRFTSLSTFPADQLRHAVWGRVFGNYLETSNDFTVLAIRKWRSNLLESVRPHLNFFETVFQAFVHSPIYDVRRFGDERYNLGDFSYSIGFLLKNDFAVTLDRDTKHIERHGSCDYLLFEKLTKEKIPYELLNLDHRRLEDVLFRLFWIYDQLFAQSDNSYLTWLKLEDLFVNAFTIGPDSFEVDRLSLESIHQEQGKLSPNALRYPIRGAGVDRTKLRSKMVEFIYEYIEKVLFQNISDHYDYYAVSSLNPADSTAVALTPERIEWEMIALAKAMLGIQAQDISTPEIVEKKTHLQTVQKQIACIDQDPELVAEREAIEQAQIELNGRRAVYDEKVASLRQTLEGLASSQDDELVSLNRDIAALQREIRTYESLAGGAIPLLDEAHEVPPSIRSEMRLVLLVAGFQIRIERCLYDQKHAGKENYELSAEDRSFPEKFLGEIQRLTRIAFAHGLLSERDVTDVDSFLEQVSSDEFSSLLQRFTHAPLAVSRFRFWGPKETKKDVANTVQLQPFLSSYVDSCRSILAFRAAAEVSMGMQDDASKEKGVRILVYAQVLAEALSGFISTLASANQMNQISVSTDALSANLTEIQAATRQVQEFASSLQGELSHRIAAHEEVRRTTRLLGDGS